MFYSHQLLSRKAPLGQIWIAATMHTKINRRNVDKIDIVEICEQILNPAVPLALRLSAILMGGVVIIYNKKVKFLYDDVIRFMVQIKKDITKSRVAGVDTTVLPKGRSQAKFENVTINYGLHELDDVEQLMSHTKERHQISLEEFFLIPNEEPAASPKHKFQADVRNITLPDDNLRFEQRYHDKTDMFDEDRLMVEPENDILPPELNLNTEQRGQEQGEEIPHEVEQVEAQPDAPKSPELDAQKVQPPIKRTNNRPINNKRRKKKSIILDEDFTVIPPGVYQEWLNDPSDIVKDDNRRLKNKKERARRRHFTREKLMSLPSTLFFSMSAESSPDLSGAAPLLELWNQNVLGREKEKIQETLGTKIGRSSLATERRDEEELTINIGEAELINKAYENMNMNDDIGMTIPHSREKVRHASPDLVYNIKGLTPMPSGQSTKSNKVTPASEPLGSVNENSMPTTKRPKRKHITPDGLSGVFPNEEDMLEKIDIPQLEVISGENQKNNLSQFDLMVDTGSSQRIPYQTPKESMDNLTMRFIDHFRDHFSTPRVPPKQSLNQLSEGMDRRQAARLFYQTCVLATHKYVKVEQEEAYGDIMIQRGLYL